VIPSLARRAVRLACVVLLLCGGPRAAERFALLMGQNAGLPGDARLLYAGEDARRLHEVLVDLGGVAPGRAYLLRDPGVEDVLRTLSEIRGRILETKAAGRETELLVFYSGHADATSLHLAGRAWPLDSLRAFLEGSAADLRVAILDACNSGAFITRKGGRLAEPVAFAEDLEGGSRGSVILTSSSAGEYSVESKALRGSLFTHYLLSGLRGAADYNRDREVSLWEAYHYARVQTVRRTGAGDGARQSPRFDFQVAGSKDMALTLLGKGSSRIVFSGCEAGVYGVYGRDMAEQWAEVETRQGDTVELRLPRMEYAVQRVDGKTLHTAMVDLRYRPEWILEPADFRKIPLRDYRIKGASLAETRWEGEVRLRTLRQVPETRERLWIPEAGASVRRGAFRLGVSAGRLESLTRGADLSIGREGFAAGFSLGRERYLARWATVTYALRYAYYRWTETRTRTDEAAIRAMGYPAMPDRDAAAHGLGGDLRARILAGRHAFLEAGAGPEALGYRVSGRGYAARLEWPLAFSFGVSFP
jgi:hypothetical protein